jgi:hypothetical protein
VAHRPLRHRALPVLTGHRAVAATRGYSAWSRVRMPDALPMAQGLDHPLEDRVKLLGELDTVVLARAAQEGRLGRGAACRTEVRSLTEKSAERTCELPRASPRPSSIVADWKWFGPRQMPQIEQVRSRRTEIGRGVHVARHQRRSGVRIPSAPPNMQVSGAARSP